MHFVAVISGTGARDCNSRLLTAGMSAGTEEIDDTTLLTPSTFSVAAFREASRAKRSPSELTRILIGEQAVLRARAARAKQLQSAASANGGAEQNTPQVPAAQHSCRHTWSADELKKIQRGKEAAQRMKASTSLRKSCRSLRDSCNSARSSVTADGSNAECKVFLKRDVHTIKMDLMRYEDSVSCLDSPRSLASCSSSPQGRRASQQSSRMQQPVPQQPQLHVFKDSSLKRQT